MYVSTNFQNFQCLLTKKTNLYFFSVLLLLLSLSTISFFTLTVYAEPFTISFDDDNYEITQTATLTITDPSLDIDHDLPDFITAKITSKTDSVGVDIILNETGDNTGIFNGMFTFTASGLSSGSILNAQPGDPIYAISQGQETTATILPIVDFLFLDDPTTFFNIEDSAIMIVQDNGANIDPNISETISVHVVSTVDTNGITLPLVETGDNTGIFSDSQLFFMIGKSPSLDKGPITIKISEVDENFEIGDDSFLIAVATDTEFIELELHREGSSSTFSNMLTIGTTSDSAIQVVPGDILSLFSSITTRWLIETNPDPFRDSIQVKFTGNITEEGDVDDVTASYNGFEVLNNEDVTKTIHVGTKIETGVGPGIGGGGIGPPSIIITLSSIGSSFVIPPIINIEDLKRYAPFAVPAFITELFDSASNTSEPPLAPKCAEDIDFNYTLSINNNCFYVMGYSNTIETQVLETEKIHSIDMTFFENKHDIRYVEFNFYQDKITMQGGKIDESDTQIIYNKDDSLQIVDPTGLFNTDDVKIKFKEIDSQKIVHLEIAFAKPIENLDLMVEATNTRGASGTVLFYDPIKIIPIIQNKILEATTPKNTIQKSCHYTNDILSVESNSLRDIILNWIGYKQDVIVSDYELLRCLGITSNGEEENNIPHWFKKHVGKFFYDDVISESDFKIGIEYIYNYVSLTDSLKTTHIGGSLH